MWRVITSRFGAAWANAVQGACECGVAGHINEGQRRTAFAQTVPKREVITGYILKGLDRETADQLFSLAYFSYGFIILSILNCIN
jgi:hypothetical protein